MQSFVKASPFKAICNSKVSRSLPCTNLSRIFYSTHENSQAIQKWKSSVSEKTAEDTISASQINLMGNTLDYPNFNHDQLPSKGTEIPPGWHFGFFPPRVPEKSLSEDGYDTDWKPPNPYTNRLWAGGKLEWNTDNPLRVGDKANMQASLRNVDVKQDNKAAFVWADYKFSNQNGLSLSESRCWIYTDGQSCKKKEVSKVTDESSTSHDIVDVPDFTFTVTPSPITLFRFSALTFNAHLIHYSNAYATQKENKKDCLVHGPLSLVYMINQLDQYLATKDLDQGSSLKNSKNRKIKSIDYRCLSPLFVNEPLTVSGRSKSSDESGSIYDLWITDKSGTVAVKGAATIEKIK